MNMEYEFQECPKCTERHNRKTESMILLHNIDPEYEKEHRERVDRYVCLLCKYKIDLLVHRDWTPQNGKQE